MRPSCLLSGFARFGRAVLKMDERARKLSDYSCDPLEKRVLLATDLSPALITAIKNNHNAIFNTVDAIHDRVFNNVLARSLPLIGTALNVPNGAADMLNAVSSTLRTKVGELVSLTEFGSSDINQKLTEAADSLDMIQNPVQTFLNSSNEVEYLVPLHGTLVNLTVDPAFNLSLLPGLGLAATGGTVNVELGYDLNLKLGFNTTDLVYIDLGPANEMSMTLTVTTPGLALEGTLALLKVTASNTDLPLTADRKTKPTHFDANFALDFTDGPDAGNTKLTLGEIGSLGLTPTFGVNSALDLNLKLNVDFGGGGFPSFEAYLNVGWDFTGSAASVSTPAASFGGVPSVSFNNVSVDLGSFLSRFASPVITEINKVFKPVRPIMEKLYENIPALTTINRYMIRPPGPQLDIDGDGFVSIRDLLSLGGANLRFLDQFKTFLDIFPDVPEFSGSYKVPLGNFDLTQNQLNGGGAIDVRTLANLGNVNLSSFSANNAIQAIKDFALGNDLGDVFDFFEDIGNETLKKQMGDVGEGMKFPLLENPEKAFGLFLGQNPILFYFDMNPIIYNVPLNLSIRPPAFPFVSAGLRGSLGDNNAVFFRAKFAFGYDTFGLTSYAAHPTQPGRLFDGFYVSDRANPDGTGADEPEVRLDLGVEIFGSVGVPVIAELVLGGGPQANILANLKDPDNDGRVRLSEISDGFAEGPLCAFDISGELKSVFRLVLETALKDIELASAEFTILSFTLDCGIGPDEPVLAHYDAPSETLYLNTGPRSADRLHGDLTDADEKFFIKHMDTRVDGSEVVEVNAYGLSQNFGGAGGGVRHIVAEGGAGNDDIALGDGVTSSMDIWGDFNPGIPGRPTTFGNDHLVSGSGTGTLHGGEGDDELAARVSSASLLGEGGNDRIFGSPGAEYLDGGAGHDTIFADSGDDTIVGASGNDDIYSGDGNDTGDGGDGDDLLFADIGNDTMTGGNDNDQLYGFDGNDVLDGGAGNDVILGEAGADTITGGTNDDTIVGGADNDSIAAGAGNDLVAGDNADVIKNTAIDPITIFLTGGNGNDTVFGEAGNDLIYGQAGNDSIVAGSGLDTLLGADGNDTILGDADADSIAGDNNDDSLEGGAGNDTIDGAAGSDTIRGGTENDSLIGGTENDTILGDEGADSIAGNSGNDSIEGGIGNDTIAGADGLDILRGQNDNDTITGGNDADMIFGDAGADSITGDAGDDSIEGATGNDTIQGNDGSDTIHGQDNDDQISGGNQNDSIFGGLGNDSIDGNDGNDSIQGNAGDDVISGLDGLDSIRGDAGNDSIAGGNNPDFIRGGTGNDTVDGGAANDIVHGEDGNDSLTGGLGADRIEAGVGDDVVYVFALAGTDDNAADTARGGDGNDAITGAGGPDYIDGGAGTDTLAGNDNNDTLIGNAGVGDSITGGLGADRIVGSDDGSDSDPNFADAVYFGDIIDGGGGHDTIYSLGGADLVMGGTGNDSIDSGAGGDSVSGGEGSDFIYAGQNSVAGDNIAGLAGADTIWGSESADTIGGGDDNDSILAQNGADSITGDGGDDIIDSGAGSGDFAAGGTGDDAITDSGGASNTLHGDSGNDTLTGSNDGSDSISGGTDRDCLSGRAGNDTLIGGSDDDTIHGNAGDDSIIGDSGADMLVGGEHHDTIDGGDGIDSLYGDLGTNGNEANSGRDVLFGQGSNDLLYGEGDLDSIVGGAGAGNLISYGPGGSTTPEAYTPPAPTAAPTIQPPPAALTLAGATLPGGDDYRGRWTELASSASGNGLSISGAIAIEPAIVIAADGSKFVAWVDGRRGNDEIYVAKYTTAGGWQQLNGSASEGGISNTLTSSRRPSITIGADGNPIVAWAEITPSGSDVRVAKFDGASWIAIGTSLSAQGISNTGIADRPVALNTTSGPVVAWMNGANVYRARQFTGGSWQEFGAISSASGLGVSNNAAGVGTLSAATDGTKLAIAWSALDGAGVKQIYLREFNGATWSALGTSFSASGLSNTAGDSVAPSVAYLGGSCFVSWQDNSTGLNEIFSARFNGTSWVAAGGSLNSSNTHGDAIAPHLAASAGGMTLAWSDDTSVSGAAAGISVYSIRWNGSAFVAELATDNTGPGVAGTRNIAEVAIAASPAGRPTIAAGDASATTPQIFVRANDFAVTQVVNAGAGFSVQSALDGALLGSGSVILVSGTSAGFTVSAADAGVTIIGQPGATISGAVTINAANVTLQGLTITGTLTVNGASFTARDSALAAVQIAGAADTQIAHCTTGLLTISGGAGNTVVEHNTLGGVTLGSGGAANLTLRDNVITATVSLASASSGAISRNRINVVSTGLSIAAAFVGTIADNDITGTSVGVAYNASATLSGNRVFGSGTGVTSNVAGANGFGFVGLSQPNQIYSNTTGVMLTNASMQNQHVASNTTGVSGSGTLGGSSLDLANFIELNGTGVNFSGPVRYNRVARNDVGILASSNQLISHNIVWNNTQYGLRMRNVSNVRVFSNTLYTNVGDNLRLDQNAFDIQVINNVLSSEGGFDINVADDSRGGFFSDHNLLHSAGAGKLVHWLRDFNDLLDWQMDLGDSILRSIGRTAINPQRSDPLFANKSWDDFHTPALLAGQRASSITIDAGSSVADQGADIPRTNLLANPSFESGVSGWTVNAGGTTQAANPAPWEGAAYFYPATIPVGFTEQTINLVSAGHSAAQLDSQDLALTFGGRIRTVGESVQIVLTFLDGASSAIGSPIPLFARNVGDRWELLGDRRAIPVGSRSVRYRFESNRLLGTTNDAYFDSGFVYVESENTAPDLGAYGNAPTDASQIQPPHVAVRNPDLYSDLILTKPIDIQWDSFGNTSDSSVRIDLYQDSADGPALLLNITPGTADTGHFTWIPQSSGLSAGTIGLRVQVALNADNITLDRSSEASTVPQAGNSYFIDDASDSGDQYTPGATGNNRNTGKTPASPKPLLTTLARVYDLDPADTVFVDTGAYQHFKSLTISGAIGAGDDEGVSITGPTDSGKIATIAPLGFSTGALIDITQGDFTMLSRLSLLGGAQYGIWIRNNSTNNTASFITQSGATLDGILVEAGSTPQSFDHLDFSANGRTGVSINSIDGTAGISNSRFYNNTQYGLFISAAAPGAIFESNEAFGNQFGISITTAAPQANPVIVGNADLSQGKGNKIHDNSTYGLNAAGFVTVAGNAVYGQSGASALGIQGDASTTITKNVVHTNTNGIASLGIVTFNRVYNNSSRGIQISDSPRLVSGNVVYSNGIGIYTTQGFSDGPNLQNNVVYANSARGVQIVGARNATVFNNTIYQPSGDAIVIDPGVTSSVNLRLANNLIHVGSASGYGIKTAQSMQATLVSDYNLFYMTNGAKVGIWQNTDRPTLASWRAASLLDASSLSGDPLYVDFDGPDNLLGYTGGVDRGSDDNFHENSPNGSFKGASLAPVLDGTSGLPVNQTGSYSIDAGSASPVIDHGDGTFGVANEPAPNGGFINIGAYGNTNQASKSEAQYTLVLSPNGGETAVAGQNFNITWRQENLGSSTVAIELLHQAPGGALTLEAAVAPTAPNTGSYTWAISAATPLASDYVIRVTRNDAPAISDISDAAFSIAAATPFFYVNDATVQPGDFTTQPGNDANDGLTPVTPKASLQALLNAYDLGPGDVIKLDRGVYNLTNDIVVTNQDSGVTITGFTGIDQSALWAADLLADAPTHYYRLGESSGTTAVDSSGHGFDATYENGVTLGATGALKNDPNTAASFDGTNDRVHLPNGFASFPTGFSFETWVYPTASAGAQTIFELGNGPANNNLLLYRSGTSLTFQVYNGQGSLSAANALTAFEWNHIAVTMTSGNAAKIYSNGQLLASGNVTQAANVARTSNFIGHSNWSSFAAFAGKIDEAAFYDQVLTAAQISDRYALVRGTASEINRGNLASGIGIDLNNADNITINNLALTGGFYGIRANNGADSDNLTLTGNDVYANADTGVYVGSTNDAVNITQNKVHGNFGGFGANGVTLNSVIGATITDNDLYGNTRYNVEIAGNSTSNLVSLNRIFGGVIGIQATSAGGVTPNIISNNDVHHVNGTGISVSGSFIVRSNTVHDILTSTGLGISAATGEIRDNVVYNNVTGIQNGSPITGNRVFNNSLYGIVVNGGAGVVENNQTYGNGIGIFGSAPTNSSNGPYLRSNLVYQNITTGIRLDGGRFAEIINNTVYQPTGSGIALNSNLGTFNDTIKNNIIVVGSGTGLALANTTHTGLVIDYNDVHVTGGGNFGSYGAVNYPTRAEWYFEFGFDQRSLAVDPQFADLDGADNLLGFAGGVDHGADDNFALLAGSPAIDAGDPSSYFLAEPQPSGGRVNLGHHGNTALATASPSKTVQVLSPNGLEKLGVGTPFPITFRSAGLGLVTPVMLMNPGGTTVGPWLAGAYVTASANAPFTIPNTIDTSLVVNPAPQQVYQQLIRGVFGTNQPLSFKLPLPDGSYAMRLHFIEPEQTSAGTRVMDVKVNGSVVTSNYDPFVAAGNMRFKATSLSHNVTASGGAGLALDLISKVSNYAILSGIEITSATPAGSATPKANIEVSLNNGLSFSPVTNNVVMDAYGQGSFLWTPDAPSDEALIRVMDVASPASDVSNTTFLISGSGSDFYLNDNSTAGDFFTTAVGNDINNGKSPSKPMRTLAALIAAYDFQPGDTIHVDTGAYTLSNTLNLGDSANDLTIEGPPTGSGIALLNRNNNLANGIRFDGADNVTLRRLSVTGALYGLYSEFNHNFPSALSTNITIDDCDIYGNNNYGIYFQSNAHGSFITNNRMHTNSTGSISVGGANGLTIDNNKLFNSSRGAQVAGNGIFIKNNEIYGNVNGIEATGTSAANLVTIQNNIVRNNSNGMIVQSADVVGNTVFGHPISSSFGILSTAGKVRDNVVYGNGRGIYNVSGVVTGNRVYNNTNAGIEVAAVTVSGNIVYNNATGILGSGTFTTDLIRNNLIYANTSYGIRITDAYTPQITNNTVYQPTGDGIRLEGTRFGTTKLIRSNIVQVNSGSGISLGNENLTDTTSDYNTIFTTGTGKFGTASGRDFATREQWVFETRQDRNSLSADPLFIDIDGADNLLGFSGGVDHGIDDNFQVQATSATIDAGDPAIFNMTEPAPNGNRINQGYTGNTAQAVTSAGQVIQVLSPNGLEKLEAGSNFNIKWGSDGLTANRTVALFNGGQRPNGTGLGDWQLSDAYLVNFSSYSNTTAAINTSGVSNPAPQDVYQSASYANGGVGQILSYRLPLIDGTYNLRLHFAEIFFAGAGRVFDVRVNGVVVQSNYDIYVAAGNQVNKAVTLSFAGTAISGGNGALIELVNKATTAAILNGIEITTANPSGIANPTAMLEYSTNNGGSWTTIASGVAMDLLGHGSYNWTVPGTLTDQALVRVRAEQGSQPLDVSNAPFQIVNNGSDYYVNDNSLSGDVFASAVGNNLNSGKDPAKPMASIFALLHDYDLDAGDVVHVDAGTYALIRNIALLPEDSGVVIQGPASPAIATLNRNSAATSSTNVFQFLGADDVTIERFAMIGAYVGVEFGLFNVGQVSNNNLIRNNNITQMGQYGVLMFPQNDNNNSITSNSIHDSIGYGVYTFAPGTGVSTNQIFNISSGQAVGIALLGSNTFATGNTVFGNAIGIQIGNNNPTVAGNTVRNNTNVGIQGGSFPNALITGNDAFANPTGISTSGTPVRGNRVFGNVNFGIDASGANTEVRANQIYSNATGLRFSAGNGLLYSNLIYANTTRGISIESSGGTRAWNNTIYSIVGDAVRLIGSSNVSLSNNILWTNAGSSIFIADATSQSGLSSDRNLFNGTGSVGSWNGAVRATLADWQSASAKDANSVFGDPLFVDLNGADNVLGYQTTPVTLDGGRDDNLFVAANSPAIDRGASWTAAHFDFDGGLRADDPGIPNTGPSDYFVSNAGSSQFSATGTQQNWRSANTYFAHNFTGGFTFPFFGNTYTNVYVGTNGILQFGTAPAGGSPIFDLNNTLNRFVTAPFIAPLWDALSTVANTPDNIFLDSSVAGQLTIRWNATHVPSGADAQFAVVLFADGTIRFDYGPGNTGLSPTAGISGGNGQAYHLTPQDGQATLTNANSVTLNLAAGITDIGALESRGDSSDIAPPTVSSTAPAAISSGGNVSGAVTQIGINLSEPLNRIDAVAPANYELRSAGIDNNFDTGDDVIYAPSPAYTDGSTLVTLNVSVTPLPTGTYRLTVRSNSAGNTGLHDRAGLLLDGDANASAGGDYVRIFTVAGDGTAPTVIPAGTAFHFATVSRQAITFQFSENVFASLGEADLQLVLVGSPDITIPISQLHLEAYDSGSNVATFTFDMPGEVNGMLPDGNYTATLLHADVKDAANNSLAADYSFDFYFKSADANHDRGVNALDFNAVATNFGQTACTFEEGDFNYDGIVDTMDFNVLAQRFNTKLPLASALPAGSAQSTTQPALRSPFADQPIGQMFGTDEDPDRVLKAIL